MEVLRQSGQHAGKMSAGVGGGGSGVAAAAAAVASSGASGHSAGAAAGASAAVPSQQSQGLAALLVMVAVLCFIVAYCCWGAPCCRAFCRRRCAAACCACCGCRADLEAASPSDLALSVDQGMVATPTIILLPYGRMLVVDGSVFAQLQADTSGLDLIELGENVVRAQQRQQPARTPSSLAASSTPSILDVDTETLSKDGAGSPTISLHPPPTYESIFGCFDVADLPPSYDEILRQIELREFRVASRGGSGDSGGGGGGSDGGGEQECLAPSAAPPPEAESRPPEAQPLTATTAEAEAEAEEEYEPGDIRESRV